MARKISVLFPETRSVANVVSLAQRCESLGFHGLFLGSAFGIDPVMALAYAGTRTERITLGVAVVPTWPRHPQVMAQQAATANAMCNGRFRLGLGPSHVPVMQRLGIAFDRPISHVREYLTIVRTLLAEGSIAHQGDRYQVQGMLDVEGGGTPPVMLAALREQMCRLAGGHADGVLPWLPSPDYIAEVVVPSVAAGAAAVGRDVPPPVIAEFPAVCTDQRSDLTQVCSTDLMIYPMMPFYRAMWEHGGVPLGDRKVAGGWSDEMIDSSIAHGNTDAIASRVDAYFAAGADEVIVSPMGVNNEQRNATLQALATIAKGG